MSKPGSSRGVLVVISSPSGGGKTTIVNAVRKNMGLEYSVSTTTRAPRKGEIDGVHYNFVSKSDFLRYIDEGRFVEWARVHGSLYGTERSRVENSLAGGRTLLLDIDVRGALQIKRKFPGALLIFIAPPSMAELEKRLLARGTNTENSIKQRLAEAENEMSRMKDYDRTVVNDSLEKAVDSVQDIIKKKIKQSREAQS